MIRSARYISIQIIAISAGSASRAVDYKKALETDG
jgi:hypothetical protein